MKTYQKFLIYYFNFSGITSFKIVNNDLSISYFAFLYNLLSFPIFNICSSMFQNLLLKDAVENLLEIGKMSELLISFVAIQSAQIIFITLYCNYFQLLSTRKHLFFIRKCLRVYKILECASETSDFKEFEQKIIKIFCMVFFLTVICHCSSFIMVMRIKLESFFIYCLFNWHINVFLYFLTLLSFYLQYFEFLLRCLNRKLEKATTYWEFEEISRNFLFISELFKDFVAIFGSILSIVMTNIMILFTERVNKKERKRMNNITNFMIICSHILQQLQFSEQI